MDNIIKIPQYSKQDDEIRRQALEKLAGLEKEFKIRAEPYIKMLSDIEARTLHKIIIPFDESTMDKATLEALKARHDE